MSLKPWREIATPHNDVLKGTFKQSEFAADISQVASGTASEEYQDAKKFFSRTFITEGMRLLLVSVAQRLAGQGGDPVIQLQTAFGGGKTHTMLAVLHLASRTVSTSQLEGIPPILDAANIQDLPHAKVAVIDGIRLSPSQPLQHGKITVHTLWGELAWQLLGEVGYQQVAASDQEGTSPGKDILIKLIQQASPCVILMDELVAFIRQLRVGKAFNAGTFDSNISFIQALTEALKSVPNAMLLASLPESELEVGGSMGERTLHSLEKYFARIESVWKPVDSTEAFEIVRRRLFESAGKRAEVEGICRQFSDFYRANSAKFPVETQSNVYFERLCQSYPIHPEIFDRLYEDWATLDKFQRTRGVLQYMAIVIHRLWNDNNQDALIMPSSLPLYDATVRNKSIHYLPTGWDSVIEKEVDGQRSTPAEIDGHDTRFGGVQAATKAARTIFLGSAPAANSQFIKGITVEQVVLGCVQPAQNIGIFVDVLKRLRDHLHYLYSDNDHFWLDTKPNLRREMESRKQTISDAEQLQPLLKTEVSRCFGRQHHFAGIHVFTASADVPDDWGKGPRLVVLPTNAGYSAGSPQMTERAAEEILRNRGHLPRQKQNRLIFLAPDYDVVNRLRDQGRTYLAWDEIVNDIKEGKLNLDLFQAKQAERHLKQSKQVLSQLMRETYKWLLCPLEEFINGKPELSWEAVSISPATSNLIQEIEQKLREEEWVIYQWSPIHLMHLLQRFYLKNNILDIGALKVYQDCCQYLYLPRLLNDQVLKKAISIGVVTSDYFAFAAGKEGDRYLGFCFASASSVMLDESSLLIDREAAHAYVERIKPKVSRKIQTSVSSASVPTTHDRQPTVEIDVDVDNKINEPSTLETALKKQFYGSTDLDPAKAKMDFAIIVDEIVDQFRLKVGVELKISIEIEASSIHGFDESLQRTIKENCHVLRFNEAEFEEE